MIFELKSRRNFSLDRAHILYEKIEAKEATLLAMALVTGLFVSNLWMS